MDDERITPTPENPIPDVDEVKPGIPTPAWADEGGSELPAVTSQDAGKVLTVSDDGEWVAGEGGGGGGGGVLIIHEDADGVLDKTWQEIHDADFAVISAIMPTGVFKNPITKILSVGDGYAIQSVSISKNNLGEADISIDTYTASSANDYPVYSE